MKKKRKRNIEEKQVKSIIGLYLFKVFIDISENLQRQKLCEEIKQKQHTTVKNKFIFNISFIDILYYFED